MDAPPPPHAAGTRLRVRAQLLHQLYEQGRLAVLIVPLPYLLVIRILWTTVQAERLLAWAILVAVELLFQIGVMVAYRLRPREPEEAPFWRKLKYASTLLSAIALSGCGWLVYPDDSALVFQMVLFVFLCASTAVSTISCSASRGILTLYNTVAWAPMSLQLLGSGDEFHLLLGFGSLVYVLTLLLYGLGVHHTYKQNLTMQELNRQLVSELSQSKLELEETLRKTRGLAMRDELTGLYNRRQLWERLEHERKFAERFGQPVCVALFDLDYFKSVNDRFGHLAGDETLKTVALVAQETIRDTDFLARYGGEEFAVVFPQTSMLDALQTVDRLRERLERVPFVFSQQLVKITLSAGVTQYRPGEALSLTLSRADGALYRAKSRGRNRVISDMEMLEDLPGDAMPPDEQIVTPPRADDAGSADIA